MRRLRGAMALLAFATALSCISERSSPTAIEAGDCRLVLGPDGIGSLGTVVAIREFRFQPEEIRVPVGARVTWVNCEPSQTAHTSTAAANGWSSPLLAPGESFSTTFTKAGTFEYFCSPHPFMRARVVVD